MQFPRDIQYLIATYAVPPVYRMAECLQCDINWYGLCSNSHPAIIPLIDDYFQMCLIESPYLSYGLLYRLSTNPTALPLLKKYAYYLGRYQIKVHWDFLAELESIIDPYAVHPENAMLSQKSELSSHPRIIERISSGQIDLIRVLHKSSEEIYQNPAIFQLDLIATEAMYKKYMEIFP